MKVTLKGIEFEVCECITCGIPYVVPQVVIDKQREVGGFHTCHAGHSQGWRESDSERAKRREAREAIRRDRDRLQQLVAQKDDEIRDARRQTKTATAKIKRLAERAKAGICPCCTRHFTNLERHMASKHKEEPNANNPSGSVQH